MPGWARPVRIFCSSPLNDSMERAIFVSAVFLMSAVLMISRHSSLAHARHGWRGASNMHSALSSDVHQRAFVLAEDDALEGARLEDAEHLDGQVLVAAQREGRGVHHLQVAADRLVERDRR